MRHSPTCTRTSLSRRDFLTLFGGAMMAIPAARILAATPGGSLLPAAALPHLSHDYLVQPVPFTSVRITGGFWKFKQDTNRAVTIPFAFKQCEESGRLKNFDLASEVMRRRANGEPHFQIKPPTQNPFDDTDAYKSLEAAAYSLSLNPDPALEAEADDWIRRIAAAQEPDGYLYTFRTMHPDSPGMKWVGQERWVNDPKLSHELYDAGHLYQAGVAYYEATGKRQLLDVCLKNANLLWRTFGDGKWRLAPGHQIVEMGLVELYRVTGDPRWLSLAKTFLDNRGPGGAVYSQADLRVVDQTVAEGHAVRANYMYSGMADVAALTGDKSYENAIDHIWDNVVTRKLYITGGTGARHQGESYGADYELPNGTAYNETCAAVAFMQWNERMFLLSGDAKYMDVFERTAYNGFISGVSESGDRFFYPNVLAYDGQSKNNAGHAGRAPWFGCACCPPNLMRMLASLTGYVYAVRADSLYVNLYAQSQARIALSGTVVGLSQTTDYPWTGAVKIAVSPASPATFSLRLRIPGWARNEPVPSDLYAFEKSIPAAWTVTINGQPVSGGNLDQGYLVIRRQWAPGDTVALDLPMPVRLVRGNEKITADRGQVAFERGPVVYCFEAVGQELPQAPLAAPLDITTAQTPDFFHDAVTLQIRPSNGPTFTAIPYYAWDNRGLAKMEVWVPQSIDQPTPQV